MKHHYQQIHLNAISIISGASCKPVLSDMCQSDLRIGMGLMLYLIQSDLLSYNRVEKLKF